MSEPATLHNYLHRFVTDFPPTAAATAKALPGEIDENYRVTDSNGVAYVLKISPPAAAPESIHFQSALLRHLSGTELPFSIPTLIEEHPFETPAGTRLLRLHSWVEGRVLDEVNPRTPTLYRSWGRTCGHLSRTLAGFDHAFAHREYKWDPVRAPATKGLVKYLNQDQKKLAEYFYERLEGRDFNRLRRSVNYNDAHEHNLIVENETVSGIIDFGDAVYTATVCELAIACAYAGMHQPDPIAPMRELINGYQSVFPIEEGELDALFDLICARLLLSVTAAAENRVLFPHNAYLSVSEASAWKLLERLRNIHPDLARAHFRLAAGYTPHPSWHAFHEWAGTCHSAPPLPLDGQALIPIDLGVGSTTLGLNHNFETIDTFTTLVRRYLEDRHADWAIGGYGEARPVYTTDAFQGVGNDGPRWRSVHLGLDFWTGQSGTTVTAPLDGTVHHCGSDPTSGGYGHTIILRHSPLPHLTFYTLYGHLGAIAKDLVAGTQVQQNQPIATIGSKDTNGGWPPHLHFQVMLDVLDTEADFPGVAYPEEREVWLGICPDPRTLIPVPVPDETPPPATSNQLLARRRSRLGKSLSVSYRRPLHILRGSMQYLYDHTGRRYLDTVNNVSHVGHEHPRVVAALRQQSAVLNTNSRYLHPNILEFAERLLATLPGELSVVHFVNSGSEANELALRMAEACTGTRRTLAMEMGYHGNSNRTIEVSSYKFARRGGQGQPPDTSLLPIPDQLRNRNLDPTPHLPESKVSFIAESILSCGGQIPLPPGYLRQVYDHVRSRGGVCIADEVQTGLGRVGSHYWAFELQEVVPDIVTIGKPIGNGHPLAAVVCTEAVAEAFANGMEYFNTFGGNPVSSAVGLSVLQVIEEEHLMENARGVGSYLTGLLSSLRAEHPIIADVRGPGLFLGFELCHQDLAPATPQATYLKERMRELGFLMSTDGPHENVLKVKPPLCFRRRDADQLVEYLQRVLREDAMQL
ncbi:4-aminobutyrate aminotransferase-like enzyme/Ser/Thr protein kinase RdoA (MazF antagonist) [Lewinella aquimaris]|uniref:4-aminobutyrate aminotransferase-like enzyme/Ser/Thr protein kinase RdoA (MazF antagonist) n=1 Tax=Neolewinella aquimaris TaxID=1835722 RepID=A0A840E1E6_9BACT|nr:aminotransferase class III-fold pyridoxal phosphate-dependent enzyme [Neolewinella aquimaris]MBB4077592.1 4-aminobutyrate aminotransferase-like enzyme/Ser/Thr protein kinase RdoA (MazF antagonist) [Neolewinella aquimaris]